MLHELVEWKIAAIRRLDVDRDATAFAEQVLARNPGPFRRASTEASRAADAARAPSKSPPEIEAADRLGALALARTQLRLILELPEHVERMLALAEDGRTAPHVRVALLHGLAYLVQPAELVQDDAPGGYGYVDDCIVIKTMCLALARMGVSLGIDESRERRALSILALALAPDDFTKMQTLMTRTWNEIHLRHMTPAAEATAEAERIHRRPLDLRYDWTTPMSPITCTFPQLCPAEVGVVSGDGLTIGFRDGGVIHTTAEGDIRGYG